MGLCEQKLPYLVETRATGSIEMIVQAGLVFHIAKRVVVPKLMMKTSLIAGIWGLALGGLQRLLSEISGIVRFPIVLTPGASSYLLACWLLRLGAITNMIDAIPKRFAGSGR